MKSLFNRPRVLGSALLLLCVLICALLATSSFAASVADQKTADEFERVAGKFRVSNKDPEPDASENADSVATASEEAVDEADVPADASETNDPAGLADPPSEAVDDAEAAEAVDAPADSTESDDPGESAPPARTGPKRCAVIFAQTHVYDYLTDSTKEDGLYGATYGSMSACYTALDESKYFDEIIVLAGRLLIKENIAELFKKLRDETREGDEIFIYWNGHGATGLPDDSGDERDGVDEFLSLYDTTNLLFGGDWARSLRETALVDDELGEYFRSLEGRKITAIFETCHSGGLAAPPAENATSRGISAKPGTRLRVASLKSFASKSTVEIKKNAPSYERALKKELDKIGTRYVDALPYGASGGASNPRTRPTPSRPASRERVDATNGGDDFRRWFSNKFNGAKSVDGDDPRDIDSNGPYNLFFSSQESEKSYGFTRVRDDSNAGVQVSINPIILAYILSLRKAEAAGVPLRFEDFANVATSVVEINVFILRQQGLLDSNATQTPVYYPNLPDVFMYAPEKLY